jgi:hypothetical protein
MAQVDRKHLATYLNDHLAGAVTLLELLGHVISAYPGTEVERFARGLRDEVTADRRELEALMERFGVSQSTTRKASAWLSEKLAQLKLKADDRHAGALRLLEATEAMSLGIEGKRSLWLALDRAAERDPALRGCDYDRLRQRAEDQRQRVEAVRLQAAAEALAGE